MADIDPNSAKAKDIDVLMEQARKAGDLLKALSHESRLLILCILAEGEKSVSELEELLSMPQAAVSQQLARLRKIGRASCRERVCQLRVDSGCRRIIKQKKYQQ